MQKTFKNIIADVSKQNITPDNSENFVENLDLDFLDENDIEIEPEIKKPEKASSVTDDIDPEFLESFNEESKDHLNNINIKLNLLAPLINDKIDINDEYRAMLHSIRRSVHTLKGAAAVIGIKIVASFGNDFEDFLDWLHDEAGILSPQIITAMFDGSDILEKLANNPDIKIDDDINGMQKTFKNIIADVSEQKSEKDQTQNIVASKKEQQTKLQNIDKPAAKTPDKPIDKQKTKTTIVDKPVKTKDTEDSVVIPIDDPVKPIIRKPVAKIKRQPKLEHVKETKTLRVDMGKIDQMIGLLGDMTINLTSHEDSSQSFNNTLHEFTNIMKRMKDISVRLETGFELATIPHMSSISGYAKQNNENIDEFDPLEMDRYSDLHILIRSLNEAVADLASIMDQTANIQHLWQATIARQRRVVNEIQNSMQLIKMAPFSTLSNRLHQTVRESARVTKKSVQLVIKGSFLEMDTHVWNVLTDPFMHLLRNSIDHGLENPAERKKTKKPDQATILIKCVRRGSWLNIHFSDDGKGLDYDKIRKKALELYPEKNVSSMTNDDLVDIIFQHGFSTKAKATTMSGRGVGMDVVSHAVRQLNGNIEVNSTPGKGTEFIIRLPITVAQLPALLVKFGQQDFAVPLRDINRVIRIDKKQSKKHDFELDNDKLPLLRPIEIMGLKPMINPIDEDLFALLVEAGNANGVLVADSIIGKRDIVFKSLGSHLHNQVPCIAGATIMGNGSLIPIIDTEELLSGQDSTIQIDEDIAQKTYEDDQNFKILIVDDSISIRKVLSNFITNQGWHPIVAKDGVDAMEIIRQQPFNLILLDIEMPRMNGFDVLQSLQNNLDYNHIPVLMLTSRSARKYKDRATELGAKGFVTKPFKDNELISLINHFIEPAISTRK